MKHAMQRLPWPLRVLLAVAALAAVLVAGYAAYYFASYYRIEDDLPLEVAAAQPAAASTLQPGQAYTIATWNLGFGAYSQDYSFFMDGGRESRARSAGEAQGNILGAVGRLQQLAPDLVLLQEVDIHSTRSWHVNEYQLVADGFAGYDNVLAVNFDSPYLFWPLLQPHGKSLSGMVTLSRFGIRSALRRSLPIDSGITRVLDLDRCYSISEIPVEGGAMLYLINLHASAYSKEAGTVPAQMQQLAADLEKYYANGQNYVIVGGDFNQDLPGNSVAYFNGEQERASWAKTFDRSALPAHFAVADYTQDPLVPTCRDCDAGYVPGQTRVVCVDGFIVSDNIAVRQVEVQDEQFLYTDHNPVLMQFVLQ